MIAARHIWSAAFLVLTEGTLVAANTEPYGKELNSVHTGGIGACVDTAIEGDRLYTIDRSVLTV